MVLKISMIIKKKECLEHCTPFSIRSPVVMLWFWRKWLTIFRQYFEMLFLGKKFFHLDSNLIFENKSPMFQVNGMALNRGQAITWSIIYRILWCIMTSLGLSELTLLPLDKMVAISQMTFSNSFCCMKIVLFWLTFHWYFLPRVKLTITKHWFR